MRIFIVLLNSTHQAYRTLDATGIEDAIRTRAMLRQMDEDTECWGASVVLAANRKHLDTILTRNGITIADNVAPKECGT